MQATQQLIESCYEYACHEIGTDSALTMDELFELWSAQRTPASDNVAAINASVGDFKGGECGTPAGPNSEQLRSEFGRHE